MRIPALLCLALMVTAGCNPAIGAPVDSYRVIHTYPHDPNAFTQGLLYIDGHLYESTGLRGHSTLRMDDLATGRVLQQAVVPAQYFGEGLTAWHSTLVQLTWQAHVAFVYDRFSFRLLSTLPFPWDGWGLTTAGNELVESDGSAKLRFLDPATLHLDRTVTVTDDGHSIDQLNELEYVKGEIYANVWHTDRIARIAPVTGKVLGWIDLSGLLAPGDVSDAEAVLNGIAYDPKTDRLFVTGKLWPKLFEIKIVSQQKKRDVGTRPYRQLV
jgi:glutaminyl-peptide cyclotransferase